ncbi:MAG: hypothetical protein WCR72_01935 [Bacteroidota bacterium]
MDDLTSGWEDVLDVDLSKKKRVYLLYRNYKIRHEDGHETFMYSTSVEDPDSGLTNLFTTVPVAKGITAFLAKWKWSGQTLLDSIMSGRPLKIKDFFNHYEIICAEQAEKDNERSINPLQPEDVIHDFLPAHLLQEMKFLAESEKYFSECLTEKERKYKAVLKRGAGFCIDWIHDSYMQLLQSNKCLDQAQLKRTVKSASEVLVDAKDIPADISLLRNMEDLLKFIYQRFYEQAFFASRSFIAPISDIPADPDVEYVYNIMLNSGIFNTRVFKDKIMALMLRSDTNIRGLLACLFSLHNIADEAVLLFENYLLHKKFGQQISFNVSFKEHLADYTIHKSITTSKGFVRLTNEDLYYFCSEISSFSGNQVYNFKRITYGEVLPEDTTLYEQSATAHSPQLPNGILEYKINAALLPLTIADGIALPCITNDYKNYLVQALVSVNKDGIVPSCKSVYQVRQNGPFYRALNEIKDTYKFKTLQIISIISGSSGKSGNTVRNNISLYKSPR